MTVLPFEIVRPPTSGTPLLFVCDHASNALPPAYGSLGLSPALFGTHIASDIGAATVTRGLAEAFGAPAVLARWSRLLVDLNRGPDDPTLIMKLSDGSVIPGNVGAGDDETAERITNFHAPYHQAIDAEIAALHVSGRVPVIVSMHSFTPVWRGVPRPWEIGILWDRDGRLAHPLIEEFRRDGFVVGNNEPYDGELENDCLYRHGTMRGIPHVLIEMRQDIVGDEAAARVMAARIKAVLDRALAVMGQPKVEFTRPLAVNEDVPMDEHTREQLEAAVFRRLVAHLRERTDVQNMALMNLAGFCRNCLGDWYREAALEKGITIDKDAAREMVYGMPPAEWKRRHQKEATADQQAAFLQSQKTHK
jgi:predicted N-formylglutamate amidohydrolase